MRSWICLVGLGICAASLRGQCAIPLGELGGTPTANEIVGDTLYSAHGRGGLLIFDMSDRAAPTLLGRVGAGLSTQSAEVEGALAALAEPGQVRIIDLADPHSPQELASVVGAVSDLEMRGTVLYVAGSDLRMLDLTDPSTPATLASLPLEVSHLALVGTVLYAGGTDGTLHTIDVSNPADPRILAQLHMGQSFFGLDAKGSLLVAVGRDKVSSNRMWSVDVSNARDPRVVAEIDLGSHPLAVALHASVAHVTHDAPMDNYTTYDMSDPAHPTLLASLDLGYPTAVAIAGSTAAVADGALGTVLLDIADPAAPSILSITRVPQGVLQIDLDDSIAFVPGPSAIVALDAGDSRLIRPLSFLPIPSGNFHPSISMQGRFLYAASPTAGFHIVDAADPSDLRVIASLVDQRSYVDVETFGPVAIAATRGRGLTLIDITNPADPRVIEDVPLGDEVWTISRSEELLLAGVGNDTMLTIDVSDPRNPTPLGSLDIAKPFAHASFAGSIAYVSTRDPFSDDGLLVVDLSDPVSPLILTELTFPGRDVQKTAVHDGRLFVPLGNPGVEIFDLADPTRPIPLAGIRIGTGSAQTAAGIGDTLFIGTDSRGVVAFDVSRCRPCAADLDLDADADSDDFFLFLDRFAAGDGRADMNGDGAFDADDLFAFLDLYAIGCP